MEILTGIFLRDRMVHEVTAPSIAILLPGTSFVLWAEDGYPYARVALDIVRALTRPFTWL